MKGPNNKDHESYKEWFAGFPCYEGVFDNGQYHIEKVDYELMKYLRWLRERLKPFPAITDKLPPLDHAIR